jgi:hypothetical protein
MEKNKSFVVIEHWEVDGVVAICIGHCFDDYLEDWSVQATT